MASVGLLDCVTQGKYKELPLNNIGTTMLFITSLSGYSVYAYQEFC